LRSLAGFDVRDWCTTSIEQALVPLGWVRAKETLMKNWARVVLGAALAAALLTGGAQASLAAGQAGTTKAKKEKSLYFRLGGKTAIAKVVDDFVGHVAADTRINSFFAHTDIPHLKMELVNQICQASGGPCKYTGKSMKEAHQGMGISTADFNALVEDLVWALDQNKVGEKEKNELLAVLGPMKSDIVEKP
jgi:hemoglobin